MLDNHAIMLPNFLTTKNATHGGAQVIHDYNRNWEYWSSLVVYIVASPSFNWVSLCCTTAGGRATSPAAGGGVTQTRSLSAILSINNTCKLRMCSFASDTAKTGYNARIMLGGFNDLF